MGLFLKRFRRRYFRPSVEGFIVFTVFFLLAGIGKRSFTELVIYAPVLALAVDIVMFGLGFVAMEMILPKHLARLLRHSSFQPFRDMGFTVVNSKLVGAFEGYFGFIACSPRDKIGHRVIAITFFFRNPIPVSDQLKDSLYKQSHTIWGLDQASSEIVVKANKFPPPEHILSIAHRLVDVMRTNGAEPLTADQIQHLQAGFHPYENST